MPLWVAGRRVPPSFPGPLIRPIWLPQGGTERNLACLGGDCRWPGLLGASGPIWQVVSGAKGFRQGELTGVQRWGCWWLCHPPFFPRIGDVCLPCLLADPGLGSPE